MDSTGHISIPGLRRLPKYYALAKEMAEKQIHHISSTRMARHLNIEPIKIRKDLEAVHITGRPKVGYETQVIITQIEAFMGWNRIDEIILVGCGDLGSALLRYHGFEKRGYRIVAAFDINRELIGKQINQCTIYPISEIKSIVSRLNVKIGILTVPQEEAQALADLMIDSGIEGIWNFSPTALNVPPGIQVQREDLLTSLAVLVKTMGKNEMKGKKNEIR